MKLSSTNISTSASVDARSRDGEIKQTIEALHRDYSLEVTPRAASKLNECGAYVEPGTTISITCLPGAPFADTLATAETVKMLGYKPAPHITARSILDMDDLKARLRALEAIGVEEIVLLAGANDKPVGVFEDTMQILETGLIEAHGVRSIGIAGHPEGSPDIPDADLARALAWKNEYARSSTADFHIVTQFCFSAPPIIAWERSIRAAGNSIPIHLGIPGLATLKTLINHAKACGVGPSMKILTKQAINARKLMSMGTPDTLLADLAAHVLSEPDCSIARLHYYPLGAWRKSAKWAAFVASGRFEMAPQMSGFLINGEI